MTKSNKSINKSYYVDMLITHSMFLKIKIQKVVHWILKILNKILKRMFSEERKLQFHSSRKDAYKQLYSPKLVPKSNFQWTTIMEQLVIQSLAIPKFSHQKSLSRKNSRMLCNVVHSFCKIWSHGWHTWNCLISNLKCKSLAQSLPTLTIEAESAR
jgi:hypothetical protein